MDQLTKITSISLPDAVKKAIEKNKPLVIVLYHTSRKDLNSYDKTFVEQLFASIKQVCVYWETTITSDENYEELVKEWGKCIDVASADKIKEIDIDDFPYVMLITRDEQTQSKFNLKRIISDDIFSAFELALCLLHEPVIWNSIPIDEQKKLESMVNMFRERPQNDKPQPENGQLKLFRSFGFPCDIDTNVHEEGKPPYIDRTWMLEDVTEVTSLFIEKGIKPIRERATRIRKISNSGGEPQNFEEVNCSTPGATFFTSYEEIRSSFKSGFHPLSKTIECSSHLRQSGGKVFVYLSGHGLPDSEAEKLNNNEADFSFGNKYIFRMCRKQCTTADQSISAGDVIGFIKFIRPEDFINEFISTCNNEDECERHLVLIVDACFSGNWVNTLKEKKWLKRMNRSKKTSILFQTSTEPEQPSNGYFFTPLFVHLNRLHEKDFENLIDAFNLLTPQEKNSLLTNRHYNQNPLFYYIETPTDNQYTELTSSEMTNQPIYSCHNLRFFNDKCFFHYFANQFQYVYDKFPDADRDLRQRPVLFQNETNRLMQLFFVQNKVAIRGMKLTRYKYDKTPLCVVLLWVNNDYRNSTDDGPYDPWHILHVHFDGRNPFPGTITCGKLLYAVSVSMQYHEERDGFKEAADKFNADYDKIYKDSKNYPSNCDKYIEGLGGYIHPLLQNLATWAQNHWMLPTPEKSNEHAWSTPEKWNGLQPTRLGNICVRERSRLAVTEEIFSKQETNLDSFGGEFLNELISTLL